MKESGKEGEEKKQKHYFRILYAMLCTKHGRHDHAAVVLKQPVVGRGRIKRQREAGVLHHQSAVRTVLKFANSGHTPSFLCSADAKEINTAA